MGPSEILVIFVLALIVLGPRRLPEVAQHLGRFYSVVRRTTWELKQTLDQELLEEERQQRRQDAERRREDLRRQRLDGAEPLPAEQPRPQVPAESPEVATGERTGALSGGPADGTSDPAEAVVSSEQPEPA